MTKRNYPIIKLCSQSLRGNHYGAYQDNEEDTKQKYAIFIAHEKGWNDSCECAAFVHGLPCYHLIKAKELEVVMFA